MKGFLIFIGTLALCATIAVPVLYFTTDIFTGDSNRGGVSGGSHITPEQLMPDHIEGFVFVEEAMLPLQFQGEESNLARVFQPTDGFLKDYVEHVMIVIEQFRDSYHAELACEVLKSRYIETGIELHPVTVHGRQATQAKSAEWVGVMWVEDNLFILSTAAVPYWNEHDLLYLLDEPAMKGAYAVAMRIP